MVNLISKNLTKLTSLVTTQTLRTWITIFMLFYKLDYRDYYCHGSSTTSDSSLLNNENGPLSEIQTATGLDVTLPCDLIPNTLTLSTDRDKVQLVIWYKEGNAKPIYSMDARGKSLQDAIHWHDQEVFKSKVHFYYDTSPPVLKVRNVRREDAGLYRCRVDFQKSPTKNVRINLSVLVPPTQLLILDELGAAVTNNIVGPYREGTSVNVTCMSSGGIPPPRVTWWKEHALIEDSFHELPDGSVKSILKLNRLTREDLEATYTCQANNGHILPPLSSKVVIEMKLPPLYVNIQGLNHPLTAGVKVHLSCSSAGARPTPQIVWTKGTHVLQGSSQTTSPNGNITTSDIVYLPTPEDNNKVIACSVSTDEPGVLSQTIRDTRILDIKHAPIVTLSLGAPLDPKNLAKGSDVYLDCDIKANPPVKKVDWYHNNKPLQSSRGIIITNQTLVLQSISKQTHGQYMCRANNAQGTVSSNDLYLDVKYPPVCQSEGKIIRAALRQVINISCDIDSNPLKNLTYKWFFNNTNDNMIELPSYSNDYENVNYIIQQDQQKLIDGSNMNMYKTKNNYNSIEQQRSYQYQYHQQQQQQQQQAKKYSYPQKTSINYYNSIKANSVVDQMPMHGIYYYKVENFSSFGTISCSAENQYGNSGLCNYHIMVADLPEPVSNCTAFNSTAYSIQIACIPGNDGGIKQHFHIEVFEESTRNKLFNISFANPNFILKKLPSDTKLIIKITSYNLQGTSNQSVKLRIKTLSAPMLRTASSRAVLVQITPLLGALVGVVVTLLLIAICIIIFVRFKHKKLAKTPIETDPNEPDKGSCEPLSRNLGSHSSIDEKNPDVIPHDNSDDEYMIEEKQFERLYTPTKQNYVNNNSPTRTSPPVRFEKQYGELSLTTNPGYALYSSPIRTYNTLPSPSLNPSPKPTSNVVMRSMSPPNIYTRLPLKEYTGIVTTTVPKTMSSSINYGNQIIQSPTKHLLVTTTPFSDNGILNTSTNVTDSQTLEHMNLGQVRMPLLNTNYTKAINNRLNGNMTNGTVVTQLQKDVES